MQEASSFCKSYLKFVFIILLLCFFKPVVSFFKVKSLPGFDGPLPFKLETGYVGVDENEDVQYFYYFVESERNPTEDPLVLWLTGGPGCSAFSGLAFEIGDSSAVSSIIFLDAPVGTGFSYSKTFRGSEIGARKYSNRVCDFIKKWLGSHPKFIKNPLYIAGDSYSGLVVPIITRKLSIGPKLGDQQHMNLKGYLLGNPITDVHFDFNSRVPFAHRMALISDELYQSAKRNCKGEYVNVDPKNRKCVKILQAISKCTDKIEHSHILEPKCTQTSRALNNMNGVRRYMLQKDTGFLLAPPDFPHLDCRNYNSLICNIWTNNVSVQKALHGWKGEPRAWIRCNKSLNYVHDVQSTLSYHSYLGARSYRALIYSGDHDMVVPYLGTLSWIKALNFSVVEPWRPWFVEQVVAGYIRKYSNHLTFATVKGGGHTAPLYRPRECFAMFERWISGEYL
ncbi:hypothetical protein K2173_014786 [Erythroxylum novogranatense]|uniref:Uncharacterized protein n=1 Tax=Erythroxylum novogranatense TaxID=1862640 RepID=A0AAV8THK5_9ROSI|nr:hypothetical protein K2173_014786 [Erythroxylum novogranatense]